MLLWTMAGFTVATLAEDGGDAMGTVQYALENNRVNQSSTWVNPDGTSGTVAPLRTFENAQGQPCREFQQTIVIGGRPEQGYGTACRQPDGTWRIVSGQSEAATRAEGQSTVYVREVARPYPYPYYPYDYGPWVYGYPYYPYWYPYNFSLSLGYLYRDGGHHHGGYYGGGHYKGGHHKGGYYKGGHYKGGYKGGGYKGGGHRR
jgi:hypothetical protein